MKITGTPHVARLLLATMLLAGMACATAATKTKAPPANPDLDPVALAALDKMGAALRGMKSFSLTSDASQEVVLDDGQKVELDSEVAYRVLRPNQLFVEVKSDRKQRQMFFDGKTLTVYSPRLKYYASVQPRAKTLGDLAVNAASEYGIEFPLSDLFYWGTDKVPKNVLTSAAYIGPGTMDGEPVDQYAMRQEGADWQVWLSTATSLPKKLVITSLDDPALPRYSAHLHWDAKSAVDAKSFSFVPPEGSARIELTPATVAATEQEK